MARGLPRDLLDRPAPEAARWIALDRLRDLAKARRALKRGASAHAIHDFRVALRRLKCVLLLYRVPLEDVASPGVLRRIARLSHAASASRDAEVSLALYAELRTRAPHDAVPGPQRAAHGLRRDFQRCERRMTRVLDRHFDALERRLRARLGSYTIRFVIGVPSTVPSMRTVASRSLTALVDDVGGHLARLRDPAHRQTSRDLHLARMVLKSLRYALEPLANERVVPRRTADALARAIVELTALQDAIGDLRDAQLLRACLRDAPRSAAMRGILRNDESERDRSMRSALRARSVDRALRAVRAAVVRLAR